MKKRFWQPLWKLEEIEAELGALEKEGWRLSAIKGLRRFEFVPAKPKEVRYFYTYLTYNMFSRSLRYSGQMTFLEAKLKEGKYGSTCVSSGNLSFFRIARPQDLSELRRDRALVLNQMFRGRALCGLAYLLIFSVFILLSVTLNGKCDVFEIALLIGLILPMFLYTVYNAIGWQAQRKKIKHKQY